MAPLSWCRLPRSRLSRLRLPRFPAAWLLALAALLPSAGPLPAQVWAGTGRAHGIVVDRAGKPIAGARVRLEVEGGAGGGPPAVETDAAGEWACLGLAAGTWRIRVEAAGYSAAEGRLEVAAEGPGRRLKILLQPAEVDLLKPFEGQLPRIREELERGNRLLAAGEAVAAREAYQAALDLLPPEQRPPVLQAIARTHYLEGDLEASLASLRRALLLAPGDEALRQLFGHLLTQLGRGAEVPARLAEIEAEAAAGGGEEEPPVPPEVEAWLRRQPDEPRPGRTGLYKVRFARPSPRSDLEIVLERSGLRRSQALAADPAAADYDLGREAFQVFVPPSYRPDGGFGLLVWISPNGFGGLLSPKVHDLLARRRLLWVGADASGNRRPRWDRWRLALDAAHNLGRLYALDPDRIYAAGYSGGGRVASALAILFPEVFRGGLFFFGCDFYRPLSVPDRPGHLWPPAWPRPQRRALAPVKSESRLVLVTGEFDFNREQTLATYRALQEDGFRRLTYVEVPGASHYDNLSSEQLDQLLAALDRPGGRSDP